MLEHKPIKINSQQRDEELIDLKLSKTEITGEDLLSNKVEEIPSLIEPFFQKVGLACLAGSSDAGKSSILRQMSIAIVTGESNFLGFKINSKHRSVIYVSTEDDQNATSFLLHRQTSNYDPIQLKRLRFVFETENLLGELERRLNHKPADLVIIDCFADIFGNDLKDSNFIRAFLNQYQQLANKHECLFLFLHHTGKRTEQNEPSKNNLLSGQGFEAKMRLVIELRVDQIDPNKRHLCIVKGNYLSSKHKKESYVLNFLEESFSFRNTDERIPFELLVKKDNDDNKKAKFTIAKDLKDRGYSYDEIAPIIGYSGKGSVSKLFSKAKEEGWDGSIGFPEETKETKS